MKGSKQHSHEAAVFGALRRSGKPMSAYEIIAALPEGSVLAPPTVYRALERLIASGKAHKIQSLNAFVACNHSDHQEDAAFAICDTCGSVTEFSLPKLDVALSRWSRSNEFTLDAAVIELRGTCATCHEQAA